MQSTGTKTQEDQWMLEAKVGEIYARFYDLPPRAQSVHLELRREQHLKYLTNSLKQLGPQFAVLDANRPWLCYWIIHSIALLGDSVDEELEENAIDFLNRCQDPEGGYGGGPGQIPHLATTYAAVNSLITLGGEIALSSIKRENLYAFLLRMKDTSGGFRMHDGGEVDVRACYTAISVASVLNILDDELVQHVGNYILSCQTYEGGIGGEPGSEAHGGYTFCGLAAMILIGEVHRLDLPCLIDWVVFRQGIEGGFQGRTNKLVDGCYSFWQGAVAAVVQRLQSVIGEQLGLSNAADGDCNFESGHHDSAASNFSDEEECDEGTLDPVKGSCSLWQGQDNASHPANLNNIGYNFVSKKSAMRPIFSSLHLQQYLLLCSQVKVGTFFGSRIRYLHNAIDCRRQLVSEINLGRVGIIIIHVIALVAYQSVSIVL